MPTTSLSTSDFTYEERVLLRVCVDRYKEDIAKACLEDQGVRAGTPGTLGFALQQSLSELLAKLCAV